MTLNRPVSQMTYALLYSEYTKWQEVKKSASLILDILKNEGEDMANPSKAFMKIVSIRQRAANRLYRLEKRILRD